MTHERVYGHIMAREEDGTLKVRIKDIEHPLDGRKLLVREVRGGIELFKGDDVNFVVQPGNSSDELSYAIDVTLTRDEEGGQGLSPLVGTEEMLGIAGIQCEDGEIYYHLFSFATRAELEDWYESSGSTEKVLFYLRLTAEETSRFDGYSPCETPDGFRALVAMSRMEPVRDAFQMILTRFAEEVRKSK